MTNPFKATPFRTETGRIVWAGSTAVPNSLYEPRTQDFDGNALQPDQYSYEFGLAIRKKPGETHWANSTLGAIIWAQGHRDHPQAATGDDFSWKVTDGDSVKKSSKAKVRPCDKEGYPGHWVFTFRSGYAIKFVNADGSAYLLDKGAVKVGDYVQVAGSVVGNTGKSPGVYLNHNVVSLQGLGEAITGGPDPKALGFGQGPQPEGMMPVGTMRTGAAPPPAPTPGAAPAAPAAAPAASGSPAPPPPGGAPQPQPPPPASAAPPQVPVSPAPGFVGAPGAPPAPGATPAPPPPAATPAAPAGPKMTDKAAGQTYATFIAAGWTDATLRAHGYMV